MSAPVPVRIIAIGDELLEGRTVDSNSQRIQRALGGHGVQVGLIQVVPDTPADVAAALARTEPGDIVFLSGGLGSTPDDMTRDMVAAWGGVDLVEDPALREALEERWRRRGISSRPGVHRQCQVPVGLAPVPNPVGSAPALVGPLNGRWLAMLPGVPAELAGLLPPVVARLEAAGVLPAPRPHRVWRTAQVAELALVRRCEEIRARYPRLRWSWWLSDWGTDMRLGAEDAGGEADLDAAARELDAELGHLVYARDDRPLPLVVQERMIAAGRTLSVAESCTAGMLGGALTAAPGSSGFFRGGILAYADAVKEALLGVPAATLQEHGAVSGETVRAMAAGCRERVGTDYALAVSGISGPGGGTDDKPVGTTWIAVATPGAVHAGRYRFPADRDRNRLLTVAAAVDTLRRVLELGDTAPPWFDDDTWCRP